MTASELKAALETIRDQTADCVRSQQEKIDKMWNHLDNIDAKLSAPPGSRLDTGDRSGATFAGYETPGRRLIENKGLFDMFKTTRSVRFQVGRLWPDLEGKTLIDSAALGFGTPGVMPTQILPGVVTLPRRRLTVRDLLRSRPVTGGQLGWIQETAFTNNASPQVEGSDKAESAMELDLATSPVRTIAHWVPVSKQALDDLPELRRYVDDTLIYGLKLKEELEILSGDGLGVHLSGLTGQATNYAATYAAANDTKLDTIRHAMLELSDLEEEATGFVLNPRDFHDIELIKTGDSGTPNTGQYIVGDPLGGVLRVPTLWGRPVVASNSMGAGTFLAGNFSAAIMGDRMDATIDLSESHDDFFVKNKVAIRAEERIALAVTRTTAFVYGNF